MQNIRILSNSTPNDFPDQWFEIESKNHFWFMWRLKAFIKQLSFSNIPFEHKMIGLDIGCGHGVMQQQIEELTKWIIDGADLNHDALMQDRHCQGELFLYDVHEKHSEFKEKYDFIILFDILEHLHHPKELLKSSLFHLKSGGYIFINVPANQHLYSIYDIAVGHLRRYNKKMIIQELPDTVELINMRYWGLSLVILLFLRKLYLKNKKISMEETVMKGMAPPSDLINTLFIFIMNIETLLFRRPFMGSSLLAILRKK